MALYTPSNKPIVLSRGKSSDMRAEFNAIKVAFDALEEQLGASGAAADFKLIYQGARSTDPTQRYNGTALQNGDLYFNSLDKVMKSFADGAWFALVTSSSSMLKSGGAFTGPITGTTADFSSTVKASGFLGNGSQLTNFTVDQIVNGLRFTPVNKAGDTMTGQLNGTSVVMSGTIQGAVVRQTSDERKKMKWATLPADTIERIAKMKKAGTFTDKKTKQLRVGVGAQSLAEILPEAVSVDDDGFLAVEYGPAALAIVVELAKRVVALEKKNDK